MLNQRTDNNPWRSFFALKMRCAMYPPPPGSAPGYQAAHHWMPMFTMKVITGSIHQPDAVSPFEKSGKNEVGLPNTFVPDGGSTAWSLAIIACMPPQALTA